MANQQNADLAGSVSPILSLAPFDKHIPQVSESYMGPVKLRLHHILPLNSLNKFFSFGGMVRNGQKYFTDDDVAGSFV